MINDLKRLIRKFNKNEKQMEQLSGPEYLEKMMENKNIIIQIKEITKKYNPSDYEIKKRGEIRFNDKSIK